MTPARRVPPATGCDVVPGPIDPNGANGPLFSRRVVIGGLAASGLTAGVLGSLLAGCSDSSRSGGSEGGPNPEAAEAAIVRIGHRYRLEQPAEDDRAVLLERLGLAAGAGTSLGFLRSLGTRVEEDYAAGRTVRLDGWVLSRTEGRAAALVSMS